MLVSTVQVNRTESITVYLHVDKPLQVQLAAIELVIRRRGHRLLTHLATPLSDKLYRALAVRRTQRTSSEF